MQSLGDTYNVWGRYVLRPMSHPIVSVTTLLKVSANQMTVGGFLLGIVGCVLLAKGLLVGAVLVNVWALLDYVDGGIAKKQRTVSNFGRFLDNLSDIAIASLLFVCIGIVTSRIAYSWVYLALGSTITIIRLYTLTIGYNFWQAKQQHPNQSLQLPNPASVTSRLIMTVGISLDNITGFIMPSLIIGMIFEALDVVLFVWLAVAIISLAFVFVRAVGEVKSEVST